MTRIERAARAMWPFVLRSTYERAHLENYTLRDALHAANAELHKHRLLIGGLRSGHEQTTQQMERVFARTARNSP